MGNVGAHRPRTFRPLLARPLPLPARPTKRDVQARSPDKVESSAAATDQPKTELLGAFQTNVSDCNAMRTEHPRESSTVVQSTI